MTARRPIADLIAAAGIGVMAIVLGMQVSARMGRSLARAQRTVALDEKLAAARDVIVRDLRSDGLGMPAGPAALGIPVGEGELVTVRVDGTAPIVGPATAGGVALGSGPALAVGDWVVVGACAARVLAVAAEGDERRVGLGAPCPTPVGAEVGRLAIRRYRLEGSDLVFLDGDGPPRTLAEDVDVLAVEQRGAGPRGTLYALRVAGHAGEGSARLEREVGAIVLARNQVVP